MKRLAIAAALTVAAVAVPTASPTAPGVEAAQSCTTFSTGSIRVGGIMRGYASLRGRDCRSRRGTLIVRALIGCNGRDSRGRVVIGSVYAGRWVSARSADASRAICSPKFPILAWWGAEEIAVRR